MTVILKLLMYIAYINYNAYFYCIYDYVIYTVLYIAEQCTMNIQYILHHINQIQWTYYIFIHIHSYIRIYKHIFTSPKLNMCILMQSFFV